MFVFIWYCYSFPNYCLLKGLTLIPTKGGRGTYKSPWKIRKFISHLYCKSKILFQTLLSTDFFPYLLHLLLVHYDIYHRWSLFSSMLFLSKSISNSNVWEERHLVPILDTSFFFLLIKFCYMIKKDMYQKSQVNWDSRSRECQTSPLKNFPEKKEVFKLGFKLQSSF